MASRREQIINHQVDALVRYDRLLEGAEAVVAMLKEARRFQLITTGLCNRMLYPKDSIESLPQFTDAA